MIGIIGTISTVLPAFLGAALIITLVYWGMGYIYIASSRELKRSGTSYCIPARSTSDAPPSAESVTKSPIFGLFGETLNGVATIRAYGDAARFTKQLFYLVNYNNRPFFTLWQGNRCMWAL